MNEEKVKKLINSILISPVDVWKIPNVPHQYVCPFCFKRKEISDEKIDLSKIDHVDDCPYLLAKELEKDLVI